MSEPIPEPLRRVIAGDMAPVRPLAPVWQRSVVAAAVVTVLFAVAVSATTLRSDLQQLPAWLSWGCSIVQVLLGTLLLGLALREAVPGAAVPTGLVRLAVGSAVLIQVVVGVATWKLGGGAVPYHMAPVGAQMSCMRNDLIMALPVLAAVLWMVFRALPLRAPVAGLLGGTGAALAVDAVTHLRCGMSDPRHVLVWHTGGMVAVMAAGWLVGLVWQRLRWR